MRGMIFVYHYIIQYLESEYMRGMIFLYHYIIQYLESGYMRGMVFLYHYIIQYLESEYMRGMIFVYHHHNLSLPVCTVLFLWRYRAHKWTAHYSKCTLGGYSYVVRGYLFYFSVIFPIWNKLLRIVHRSIKTVLVECVKRFFTVFFSWFEPIWFFYK